MRKIKSMAIVGTLAAFCFGASAWAMIGSVARHSATKGAVRGSLTRTKLKLRPRAATKGNLRKGKPGVKYDWDDAFARGKARGKAKVGVAKGKLRKGKPGVKYDWDDAIARGKGKLGAAKGKLGKGKPGVKSDWDDAVLTRPRPRGKKKLGRRGSRAAKKALRHRR